MKLLTSMISGVCVGGGKGDKRAASVCPFPPVPRLCFACIVSPHLHLGRAIKRG